MQVVDANGNMYGDDNLEINDINGKPKTTGGGGGGSVTSVGTTGLISGGPITTTGTISTSMNTNKLVGRSTAGTGIMEEITVGSGLTLSGGTLTNTASSLTVGTTPIASGTVGRVLFEGTGNVLQEDADLFWDNTNKRLGVGATPDTSTRLDVRAQGALITDIGFRVRNSANTANILTVNGKGQIWANGSGEIGTNTSFGELALNSNTSGTNNTAFGYNAGQANLTGIYNVFLGLGAGQNGTTAASSIFIGTNAGQNSNANNGIFIGQSTSLTGGLGTVSIGYVAGAGTGTHNVSLGYQSGVGMTTGSTNIHIGYRTVTSGITTGNYNTLIGGECVVGAVSNTAVLSDGQGNIAIRKDANNFVGVGYTGIATLGAKLDVRAQGALSTDLAFRVRNSANTIDRLSVTGTAVTIITSSRAEMSVIANAVNFGLDNHSVTFTHSSPGQVLQTQRSNWTAMAHFATLGLTNVEALTQGSTIFGATIRAGTLTNVQNKMQFVCDTAKWGTAGIYSAGFQWYKGTQSGDAAFSTSTLASITTANRQMWLTPESSLLLSNTSGITYTTNVDSFQMYSADITPFNAAPHFRTENGSIIKLYQQTTAVAAATFVVGVGTAVTDASTFDGYTLNQIVKALRNTGILA
jgi:hypothetical protein